MSGTGIRALRWGLASNLLSKKYPINSNILEIWANDANTDGYLLLKKNLKDLKGKGMEIKLSHKNAERFLYNSCVNKKFFNLIDIDCFGCPNYLFQPAIRSLSFEGIIIISSTNGRTITGHDRLSAIRHYSSSIRVSPSSLEVALRVQIFAILKQSWILGLGLKPLISFSDGRTFRLVFQLKKNISNRDEDKIGFISRCQDCYQQFITTLYKMSFFERCNCNHNFERKLINGPLWLGELQCPLFIEELINIAETEDLLISKSTKKLIKRLKSDQGLPPFCWSTAELASKLSLSKQPKTHLLAKALRDEGYICIESSIMSGQIRTNAPYEELLKICNAAVHNGH